MANKIYPLTKQAMLDGQINLTDGKITAVMLDLTQYVYNDAHQFLSDVAAGARVGAPQLLPGITTTNGIFNAGGITFPLVPAGNPLGAILIYDDTGVAGTSRLVAYIDTATGLPITPSGADIVINWDTGASKIFALT